MLIERSPKERLYWLMALFMDNKIEPTTFCDEFYTTYENDLDEPLTAAEKSMFMLISKEGSRFSEYNDDLERYPNVYVTEQEIRNIVSEALDKLNDKL